MSHMTRPRGALKAFELARGGDKMEYVFAAGLAVVIVGALALTIYFTFFKTRAAGAGAGRNMWQCQKCHTEISVDESTQGRLEEMDRPVLDCPKCGSPQPVWPMARCPACGKYFVRQSVMNRRKSFTEDACSHCGKNWMQSVQEQAGREK